MGMIHLHMKCFQTNIQAISTNKNKEKKIFVASIHIGLNLLDGVVGSPCSPRDSQESSPTPQFKSTNSSVLSFLHSSTLTSIHDHWKNHSLD